MRSRHALALSAVLVLAACTHTGASGTEPGLADMRLARAGEKIGAPVDVRYLVQGSVARGRATPVAVAIVPRIAGTLRVEFASNDEIKVVAGDAAPAAAKVAAASIHRYALEATPLTADRGTVQLIVTMQADGGRYMSVFNIPLDAAKE